MDLSRIMERPFVMSHSTFATVLVSAIVLAGAMFGGTAFAANVCSGYEMVKMPARAHCPEGTIGIATCWDLFKVPKKLTLVGGNTTSRAITECVLDDDNMEFSSEGGCDYSQCFEGLPPAGTYARSPRSSRSSTTTQPHGRP